MGPRNSPKDTHVICQPTLVHWSMCFVVQIWIMHIKCLEIQLMYKRPNEPGIIPNFSTKLLFGLNCVCKKIKAREGSVCRFAHGGDTFPLRTTSLLERNSDLQEAYTKACPNSAKKFTTRCWCHVMMPSFMIFMRVLDLQELKKIKFLNISGRAMTPRCLNSILISCMWPTNSPKDTHVIF